MHQHFKEKIAASIEVKQTMLHDTNLLSQLKLAIETTVLALKNGKRVWFCGNGGSAADAQHLAAELSGRFYQDRRALPAEALHVNTSYLTAVANDYSFEEIYARLLDGVGAEGDILFAISTSGNSRNILKAIEIAHQKKIIVVGMTGKTGGEMAEKCHFLLNVPSIDTPRIQESHILLGHIICEEVEKGVFGNESELDKR